MEIERTTSMNFWYENSKNITKLSLSDFDVNQELLNSLSKFLIMEECSVIELVFDGINLSKLNYVCCLTPNTKIVKLWLRLCKLKDKGVDDLLPVLDETDRKTKLNLLYLDCNGITCEGAKKISQVLRTNRTLKSLSLAKNSIKDEGALALVNVLSKFQLNDYETRWKSTQEKQRIRVIEYLMDVLTFQSEENQSYSNSSILNNAVIPSIELDSLKQRAESLLVSPSHAYLSGQLLRSGSNFYCPGNFTISYLNISYNRFSSNVLNAISQLLQYQQKICLAEEGIRVLKIEGFETTQTESIYKLIELKKRKSRTNRSAKLQ